MMYAHHCRTAFLTDVETRISCRVHPHRDVEIFSYVLNGELTHQDSMGNKERLMRGEVQYLSAGSGITHSEMNEGKQRCRFIQV
jgi:redox-sensitive bicupin YhaK (pirin superfamily)